jgi:tetratricopeptide (TPR) repeat protein
MSAFCGSSFHSALAGILVNPGGTEAGWLAAEVACRKYLGEPDWLSMSSSHRNELEGLRINAPLIGRSRFAAELEALFEMARAGQPCMATLLGPAGIGKSRLVAEAVARQAGHEAGPLRVYHAAARSSDTGYGAIGRLLRGRLGIHDGLPEGARLERLREEVSRILDDRDVEDVCYFLGQLTGARFPTTPLTRAVADDPIEATLVRRAILRRFLEVDASKMPICLVIEDLHRIDADSLDFLGYLGQSVRGRVVIICTARPEIVSRAQLWFDTGGKRHHRIEVDPLSDEDSARLMDALLAPAAGSSRDLLIEAAVAMAQGNPSLLERMVRIFHDSGVLEVVETSNAAHVSWKINVDRLASVKLPMTVEDAVSVRVASLSPMDRRLLEHAAAIGSVFWMGGLLVLARAERDTPEFWSLSDVQDVATLRSCLEDLCRRDYILELPESTMAGDREYVFEDSLERERIAALTNTAASRRYHQAIADWLSHIDGVREHEETCAMLAQHLERAGSRTRAGMAYLDAGDRARLGYAARKACEHYQQGLTLIGDSDASRRMDALHNLGDALVVLGKTDEALATFREMLDLAYRFDRLGKGGAAHNRIGRIYRDNGSFDVARKHLDAGLLLFEGFKDERGIAASHDDIGRLLWHTGDYARALEHMRIALEMRKRIGDRRSIAVSLNNIGLVWMDHGSSQRAQEAFEASLRIRREVGDAIGTSESLANLGGLAQDNNDWGSALRFLEEAYQLARDVGEVNRMAVVLTQIGTTHYHLGNTTEAIRVLEQAEDLCDELGDRLHLADALRALAKAYLLQGELQKAREHIKRSVDLFGQLRSKPHLAIALRTLGEVTAAGAWGQGHESRVVDYFMRSIVICKEIGNELEVARSYRAFSGYVVESGSYAQNADILREAETLGKMADEIFARHEVELDSDLAAEPGLGIRRGSEPPPTAGLVT